ncbi:hypothetical protein PLICRDRAFT_54440 [Plicaturopsis crispa FD-325 SS-3]|nr:hypothetical protein PLICRDRAFT_54440 [Plicaturopsis crispa FD-325 SS-3]
MASTAPAETPNLRHEFVFPTNRSIGATRLGDDLADEPCTYLCGNSLGPLSRRAQALVNEELDVWGKRAVEGHFDHPHGREWMNIANHVTPLLAELVGAKEPEVACLSTLTANLHLMMNTFYKPSSDRYKILCEAKAFPSDQYAFASQASLHGFDPKDAVLELSPREGEYTLREEDILDAIAKEGPSIALVLFSGVQYYTGQWFPMASITQAAKAQGCICGWDLAHAIGNVPLSLHDWDVDFAVWCSYKYVNSGPGGIAGLYIHEKWNDTEKPKYAGWWGHEAATRFKMPHDFSPIIGAQGFQQSNPSVLNVASLLGALQIFQEAGFMQPLRARSVALTADLERRLTASKHYVPPQEVAARTVAGSKPGFTIITPADPNARGAQLSLAFFPGAEVMRTVFAGLASYGVIGDKREPDVIRLAPAPLYSTVEDCERAALHLETVFDTLF